MIDNKWKQSSKLVTDWWEHHGKQVKSVDDLEDLIDDVHKILIARDNEIVKMLWSIHVDEKDEERESYNRALDRAIFKITNPEVIHE